MSRSFYYPTINSHQGGDGWSNELRHSFSLASSFAHSIPGDSILVELTLLGRTTIQKPRRKTNMNCFKLVCNKTIRKRSDLCVRITDISKFMESLKDLPSRIAKCVLKDP